MDRRRLLMAMGSAALFPTQFLWGHERSSDFSIAFGSCNKQKRSQDFWKTISATKPDVWFSLGDNIYADTKNKKIFSNKYQQLLESPYQYFRQQIPIEGIWDDHDYGDNNGGKNFSFKETSQELFLDFMNVSKQDIRWNRPGIYYSKSWQVQGKTIKAYFLDCRYFKDRPHKFGSDILGDEQWGWLEDEIHTTPGDINIFVSPFGVLENKLYVTEDWDDFMYAKRKLIGLLEKYPLPGLFFLSGDKHFGAFIESDLRINKRLQKYYEFQSSGLTHGLRSVLKNTVFNSYSPSTIIIEKNFGTIRFSLAQKYPTMTWKLQSLDSPLHAIEVSFSMNKEGQWIKSEIMV